MMEYYKCLGCGAKLQNKKENEIGFISKDNANICRECFRSINYGDIKNNLSSFYKVDDLKELKDKDVFLIIDILNPFETLIENINKYINKQNLYIIVNKIDIFPKSLKYDSILKWIEKICLKKNIKYQEIILVSTFKNINIDLIKNKIVSLKKDVSIIGYSNVGKSSLIKQIYKSDGEVINNTTINAVGTTKDIIELEYENKKIFDYPGIILEGSYQNILTVKELKNISPKKEIKIINFQLGDNQKININNFAFFNIKNSNNTNNGYQFLFSNFIKLNRSKIDKENNFEDKMESIKIEHKFGKRYDLIISGLGIITFKSNKQELYISLPKEIKYNLIESIFE